MSTDIIFRDPPEPKAGRASTMHEAFAAALRERPGEWAVFKEGGSPSVAGSVWRGRYSAFRPAGQFEATARTSKTGGYDVYVRFIGESAATDIEPA